MLLALAFLVAFVLFFFPCRSFQKIVPFLLIKGEEDDFFSSMLYRI